MHDRKAYQQLRLDTDFRCEQGIENVNNYDCRGGADMREVEE